MFNPLPPLPPRQGLMFCMYHACTCACTYMCICYVLCACFSSPCQPWSATARVHVISCSKLATCTYSHRIHVHVRVYMYMCMEAQQLTGKFLCEPYIISNLTHCTHTCKAPFIPQISPSSLSPSKGKSCSFIVTYSSPRIAPFFQFMGVASYVF